MPSVSPVSDLAAAVERAGSPLGRAFVRKTDRTDIEQILSQRLPHLVPDLDGVVEEWYLWIGRLDIDVLGSIVKAEYPLFNRVTEFAPFLQLVDLEWMVETWAELLEIVSEWFEAPSAFPLFTNFSGAFYFARRDEPGDPWRLWYKDNEKLEFQPPLDVDGPISEAPLVEDWLSALAAAIDAERLQLGTRGGFGPWDLPDIADGANYPWQR